MNEKFVERLGGEMICRDISPHKKAYGETVENCIIRNLEEWARELERGLKEEEDE